MPRSLGADLVEVHGSPAGAGECCGPPTYPGPDHACAHKSGECVLWLSAQGLMGKGNRFSWNCGERAAEGDAAVRTGAVSAGGAGCRWPAPCHDFLGLDGKLCVALLSEITTLPRAAKSWHMA